MPLENRVTPFGALISTEARGTLMGNRGCIHDEQKRIRRQYATRRWIICVLEFRGWRREVMSPRRYTELFFLDEATALAAGHRPCAECQRARYLLFRDAWTPGAGASAAAPPSAEEMDRVLHAERLDAGGGKRTWSAPLAELPPGVMVAGGDGEAYLVSDKALVQWRPEGYGGRLAKPAGAEVRVLTPRSIVRALAAGYPVVVHPSAGGNRPP
jgi:hypothetical protein